MNPRHRPASCHCGRCPKCRHKLTVRLIRMRQRLSPGGPLKRATNDRTNQVRNELGRFQSQRAFIQLDPVKIIELCRATVRCDSRCFIAGEEIDWPEYVHVTKCGPAPFISTLNPAYLPA